MQQYKSIQSAPKFHRLRLQERVVPLGLAFPGNTSLMLKALSQQLHTASLVNLSIPYIPAASIKS